ncbi:MAG: hypothetical protein QM736_17725 [Vicinamibacterales bacterium]
MAVWRGGVQTSTCRLTAGRSSWPWARINGRQTLRTLDVATLLRGDAVATRTFELGTAVPSNFTFSPDGRYVYGSAYYTGVSNIFRIELATGQMQALTNSETGFFQPTVMADGSLIVFRYTGRGFVPARIASVTVLEDITPISLLGHETVEKRPVLKAWKADSPADAHVTSIGSPRPYRPLARLERESIYPAVEGYKNTVSLGAHLRFSDPVGLNNLAITAGYSPFTRLPDEERLHVRAEYARYDWTIRAALNDTDFYNLFGPTKSSRKGYSLSLGHTNLLLYDEPRRMTLEVRGQLSGDLDRLPEFQNVAVDVTRLVTATTTLTYTNLRRSLGAVDDEAGMQWSVSGRGDYVNDTTYARVRGTWDVGVPLPAGHTSLWFRGAGGLSPQPASAPFANFYFGGFGNNYVDSRDEKQYRAYSAFPGAAINEIGGRNFVKGTVELNLPPLRFSHVGTPGFYASWLRPALFASGLETNLDARSLRRRVTSAGGRIDLRLTALSTMDITFSVGGAMLFERGVDPRRQIMASLTLLR